MKFFRTILFVLLALILFVSGAVFIFLQSYNYTQYLSNLENKASQYLGRPVSIGSAGFGLSFQGFIIDVGPLVVADDPNFTAQPFIKINQIQVSLDLEDLVFKHRINIKSILLDSPQIHFIRSSQGIFNFQSLARDFHQNTANPEQNTINKPDQSMVTGVIEVVKNKTARAFNIEPRVIIIRDAAVSYIDQNDVFPLDLWLKCINGKTDDFSFSKPFSVFWQASLYSNIPNIHAQAMVSLNVPARRVTINDLKFNADLSDLESKSLEDISPGISGNPFLNSTGQVQLDISQLEFTPVKGIETQGELDINNGVVKNVNVVKLILSDALRSFVGGGFNIDHLLGNQASLTALDTSISKANVQFALHDQDLQIREAEIETNIFEFKAQGSIEKGKGMDLQTVLHLNPDVSSDLVNQFQGLKLLYDDSQRITVEASLTGEIPHLKYKPTKDFRKKSKKALMREGFNMLGAFLGGKLFK